MPRNQGITLERWAKCDRCGFSWPESRLVTQKGLRLCPHHVDRLDVEERTRIIGEVLREEEAHKDHPELHDDSGELVF